MKVENVRVSGIAKRYEFRSHDGERVNASYINRPEKHIICLSTQVGCLGGCLFCSTGTTKPFVRNLSCNEMIEMARQIQTSERLLHEPLLISFMGSGEPLDNIDSVVRAIKWFPVFARFAVSVSGRNISRVAELPSYVKVQFTLISPFERKRKAMQPSVDSLECLKVAAMGYSGAKELNVPLIKGFNDGREDVSSVVLLSRELGGIPVKLNKFHSIGMFESSVRAMLCLEEFRKQGVKAEYYETDGESILAACGQLDLCADEA